MNQSFDLSIIISSYNRDDKVLQTVRRLFESDLEDFQKIELIVIDDGSPRPVADLLTQLKEIPQVIDLKLIRQENSGIGATRNRGFNEAGSPIVLFLDDDILLKKDTLKNIFRAQSEGHGAVIFGSYPFVSHETEALHNFARKLFGYDEITDEAKFEKVNAITSGLLCVDKSKLKNIDNFYQNDLTIPAAEEYEIIYRFYKLNIPIVHAKHIFAVHNHHLELDWLVRQQYKYGLGTAEAFLKYPEIENLESFGELKNKLQSIKKKNAKNIIKSILASAGGRKILLLTAKALEKIFPKKNQNFIFGMLTSSFYWAGYLEGERRFSQAADF
jgi:glycosyltransferase involved in cell wall biosynthesis